MRRYNDMGMRRRPKKAGTFDICIPDIIMEILLRQNLSPYETRVLLFLLQEIYPTGERVDRIYLSTIGKSIGLDRRNLDRTLDKLSSKQMILKKADEKRKNRKIVELRDLMEWKITSKKMKKT
jgi:DNA-binding MarR family transcriptional regulator